MWFSGFTMRGTKTSCIGVFGVASTELLFGTTFATSQRICCASGPPMKFVKAVAASGGFVHLVTDQPASAPASMSESNLDSGTCGSGITVVLARFMPFLRTFAPFVAGVAEMSRGKFSAFNVLGAFIWVWGVTAAGYFLGTIPWVQNNLEKIIWGMILLPGLLFIWGAWKAGRSADADDRESQSKPA